jgi:PAS domain-containing protein
MSATHQPLLLIQARNLITNMALPAFLTDTEGALLFFNDAAAELLGRSFEEIGPVSRNEWGPEFGPFDETGRPLANDHQPLANALRSGHPVQGRFYIGRRGENLREVEVSVLPLQEPGNFEGALVAMWPVEDGASERCELGNRGLEQAAPDAENH